MDPGWIIQSVEDGTGFDDQLVTDDFEVVVIGGDDLVGEGLVGVDVGRPQLSDDGAGAGGFHQAGGEDPLHEDAARGGIEGDPGEDERTVATLDDAWIGVPSAL